MQPVLLVERSATMRYVLARHLDDRGYPVDAVPHFDEAVQRLLGESGYLAAVVGWPPDAGAECETVLECLAAPEGRDLPVILMVGGAEPRLREWAIRRGQAALTLWQDHQEVATALHRLLTSAPPTYPGPRGGPEPERPIRVLFVDDSASMRRFFHRLLSRHGYDTEVAADGEAALGLARARPFDIAIIDYFMPGARGDEICRRLRDDPRTAGVTCAIITGTYLDPVIKDCLDAGAVECMFKDEADALFLARVDAMSRLVRTRKGIVEERERLAGILSSVGEGVYGVDPRGRIAFMNPAACRILGVQDSDTMIGEYAHETFHSAAGDGGGHERTECALDRAYGSGQAIHSWETVFWHRSGQPIPVECTVHPLRIGGRQEGSVVAFRDISRRKDIEERLRWQATHDPLTELCNRRHLEEAIERELSRLRRSRERSALVYIDLDRFKHINDTAGHAAGDELLIAVSRELRARLRSSDLLARLGGDEFAVLLRNVAEDDIEAAAERFRGALADCAFSFDGRRYEISGSVGVTLLDGRSGSPGDALANGDIACHIAKREGRNRIHIYAADRDERVAMDYELGWSSRLRQALEHDRFVLHFQPIVSVDALAGVEAPRDGRTLWEALDAGRRAEDERYEVLVRLAGARNEVIRPDAFIPTAERLDLMPDIDAWVVRRAMERLAAVERESGRCTFTINLSGHSLCSPGLAVQVAETVEALGIDPRRIVFEIAETAAIANLDAASRFIEDIRAVGCGFALDDFGSGFSSFAHLKHLPVEYVKIEGAFVQGMARDPVDRAMVASMNDIAHALGCRTIAECVESAEALDGLRALGVDYVQGHYISRPLAAADALPASAEVNALTD